jgi:hypothetical protein
LFCYSKRRIRNTFSFTPPHDNSSGDREAKPETGISQTHCSVALQFPPLLAIDPGPPSWDVHRSILSVPHWNGDRKNLGISRVSIESISFLYQSKRIYPCPWIFKKLVQPQGENDFLQTRALRTGISSAAFGIRNTSTALFLVMIMICDIHVFMTYFDDFRTIFPLQNA